ncbi:MAG: response regulator [Cytophagales bacterium]|nr:response regulator [Cytophagales bacterium]
MEHIRKFKIFIVDDDLFCLNLYERYLMSLGMTDISVYDNGSACLNDLVKKPEVVFLDHNMEVLNGFEMLKKIKRYDPNIHVVMVSAQEDMKTAIDSLKFGAFDYIIKDDQEKQKMGDVLSRIKMIEDSVKQKKYPVFKKLLALI